LLGDQVSARRRIEAGISEHRRIGERALRAIYLNVLAKIVQQQGDLQTAARYYQESLELLQKMGLENHIAEVLYNLAFLTQSQGHPHMAKILFQDSLDIRIKQKDEQGIVRCQDSLAEVNSIIGENRPVCMVR
jgi:tetratricopeptide (TPR) repeat protein